VIVVKNWLGQDTRSRWIHAPVRPFVLWTSSNDRPSCLENSRRAAAELCRYEKSPALHFRLSQHSRTRASGKVSLRLSPCNRSVRGFEGEYHSRVRHRVSRATVCPLGQPNKAVGHEFLIEPWLVPSATTSLKARSFRTAFHSPDDCNSRTHQTTGSAPTPTTLHSREGAGCRKTSPRKVHKCFQDFPALP
jgi:hypothetical protein